MLLFLSKYQWDVTTISPSCKLVLISNLLLFWDRKKITSRNIKETTDSPRNTRHIVSLGIHPLSFMQLPCYLIYTSYLAKPKYFPRNIQLSGLKHSSFPTLITRFPSHMEESTKQKPSIRIWSSCSYLQLSLVSFLPVLNTTSKSVLCNNHRLVTILNVSICQELPAQLWVALTSPIGF